MKSLRVGCIGFLFGMVSSLATAQVTFQFDYTKDSGGFFGTAGSQQRQTLEAAGSYLSSFLNNMTLSAITPTGTATSGNRWNSSQPDPATGTNFNLGTAASPATAGPSIAANTIIIYVGSRDLPSQIAYGAQGGWSWNGTTTWQNTIYNRGASYIMPKIGSISFDSLSSWYFDNNVTTVEPFTGKIDFFSVAVHEMIHVLGQFDRTVAAGFTSGWTSNISGSTFNGTNANAIYSGDIPLTADLDHWAEGTQSYIAGSVPAATLQEALMDPTFNLGVRKYLTELDLAALRDMGFTTNASTLLVNVSAVPEPSTVGLGIGVGALVCVCWVRRRMIRPNHLAPDSTHSVVSSVK